MNKLLLTLFLILIPFTGFTEDKIIVIHGGGFGKTLQEKVDIKVKEYTEQDYTVKKVTGTEGSWSQPKTIIIHFTKKEKEH